MAVEGVALVPKFQLQVVALLDRSVKVMEVPVQVVVELAVKSANVAAQKLAFEYILTLSLELGQTPLLMLQINVVIVLLVKVFAVEVGEAVLFIEHEPLLILHNPLPTSGVFAFKFIVEPLQMLVSFPALATVGLRAKLNTTLSLLGVQEALLIVQRKVYETPAVPVKVEVGEEVFPKDPPAPLTFDQSPVPNAGVLAARVAVVNPQRN